MRLDKFLKLIRVIKRRSIAQELCDAGNVEVNSSIKKPAYVVKKGDEVVVKYFNHTIKFKVLELPTQIVSKDDVEKFISFSN
ncbi:RNA-binding S4 domain-containing protein [Caviibacter abscessus]|uniref:RNA-binding S4 domain-containing protein n=1 Tax=Caviibacter abscessus TaxID=1766719 RepID=UPI00083407DE|nr:S4 domain-containing protein [Caviibacter abscessus]